MNDSVFALFCLLESFFIFGFVVAVDSVEEDFMRGRMIFSLQVLLKFVGVSFDDHPGKCVFMRVWFLRTLLLLVVIVCWEEVMEMGLLLPNVACRELRQSDNLVKTSHEVLPFGQIRQLVFWLLCLLHSLSLS